MGTKKELLCDQTFEFVQDQAKAVAKDLGAEFWAVSAKTGENVDEFFSRAAVLAFQDTIHREINANRIERPVKAVNKFIRLKKNRKKAFSCVRF